MTENLPDESARSKVTVLRDDVEPGSEAQIGYGFLGQWINPSSGKGRTADPGHGGELGHLDFLQVLCQDEITRRETVAFQQRLQKTKFEQQVTWRSSTSPLPRSCPRPRSATWPPCADSMPESR
ncbi:hypothetical protein [Streptomyces sp. CBMA156]|uniref:hypothetical protein n=1 Tax=Streptomyces sp. CBMA156 TaxID=1930280 RepID=UPI00294FF2F8|nr:hypothetical protein [Streptomyces sp. CBMA156]